MMEWACFDRYNERIGSTYANSPHSAKVAAMHTPRMRTVENVCLIDDKGAGRYSIVYEVRPAGAIGVFQRVGWSVVAESAADAFEKYREHFAGYEFGFPHSIEYLGTEGGR